MTETASDLQGRYLEAFVLDQDDDRLNIEFDGGESGFIPLSDFFKTTKPPATGDKIRVYVEKESSGKWLASKDKADRITTLDQLKKTFADERTVEGEVVGVTDGGFNVDVGVKAFLPASHAGLRLVRDPAEILGQVLTFQILRFERGRQNVVLSRRILLEGKRDMTFETLKNDAIVTGVVTRFADFGAFVEVEGLEGLLHTKDMSYKNVNPKNVVSVGQELKVKVLRFDAKTKKVSFGLRQLEDDPWIDVDDRYPAGKQVEGLVVSKTDYGCFIQVESGVEGLVLASGPGVDPAVRKRIDKVDIGDELKALVLETDISQRRMTLKLLPLD